MAGKFIDGMVMARVLCAAALVLVHVHTQAQAQTQTAAQCTTRTALITPPDYYTMYRAIATAITATNSRDTPTSQRGDFSGGILRLAFHDAAEFMQGADDGLGPDGCFDASQADNAGLAPIVADVDVLWLPFCRTISRADFWVLAATVAVETTVTEDTTASITLPFRYGRGTNSNCTYDGATRLPGAEQGESEIQRVLVGNMGLTETDAVALLGAHTLGRSETANSGYDGPWTRRPGEFDNTYFESVVNQGWTRNTLDATHTTWLRGGGDDNGNTMNSDATIMLNADMELAFEAVDSDGRCGGNGGGGRRGCDENDSLASITRGFIGNDARFFAAFSAAFGKMTELGHTTLRSVALATCSCPNGTPLRGEGCSTDGATMCSACGTGHRLSAVVTNGNGGSRNLRHGEPCEFPFTHLGVVHYACASDAGGAPWCGTHDWGRKNEWGYCKTGTVPHQCNAINTAGATDTAAATPMAPATTTTTATTATTATTTTMPPNACTCSNGSPATGAACPESGGSMCASCDMGYTETANGACQANWCSCTNGIGSVGTQCPAHGTEFCTACSTGYTLLAPPAPVSSAAGAASSDASVSSVSSCVQDTSNASAEREVCARRCAGSRVRGRRPPLAMDTQRHH